MFVFEMVQNLIFDKFVFEGFEVKWDVVWVEQGIYLFDCLCVVEFGCEGVYLIDILLFIVFGSFYIGYVFFYMYIDVKVWYECMCGKIVFYLMGWDDNGFFIECCVQNYYGVCCDLLFFYDVDFILLFEGGDNKLSWVVDQQLISCCNFIELCECFMIEDEKQFEVLFCQFGLSVDWIQIYCMIFDDMIWQSQFVFFCNIECGEVYQVFVLMLWDIDFCFVIVQVEFEDCDQQVVYYMIEFFFVDGFGFIVIDIMCLEFFFVCIVIVIYFEGLYKYFIGIKVCMFYFGVEIEIYGYYFVQFDKGIGVVMVCIFGDVIDIIWWCELCIVVGEFLLNMMMIGFDGCFFVEVLLIVIDVDVCVWYVENVVGKIVFSVCKVIVEKLQEIGDMIVVGKFFQYVVKFFEKGDCLFEIVLIWQWYICNGVCDGELCDQFFVYGIELVWYFDFMWVCYENWVGGFIGDWFVFWQCFFGVLILFWYVLDENGECDYDCVFIFDVVVLFIDFIMDVLVGYIEDQCGVLGGFDVEVDIFDIWVILLLILQFVGGWQCDEELWYFIVLFDLWLQGQDIICIWFFLIMLCFMFEDGCVLWKNVVIFGFIVDFDCKKMLKLKGNVVILVDVFDVYGLDVVWYWVVLSWFGMDVVFDLQNLIQVKIGWCFVIKVFNVVKFVLLFLVFVGVQVIYVFDVLMFMVFDGVVVEVIVVFDWYDVVRVFELIEVFFWMFCDDYLELVKECVYNQNDVGQVLVVFVLCLVLFMLFCLFVLVFFFVMEEVWLWFEEGFVYIVVWFEKFGIEGDLVVLVVVSEVFIGIWCVKIEVKVLQKILVFCVVIVVFVVKVEVLCVVVDDFCVVGCIVEFEIIEVEEFVVIVIEFVLVEVF